MDYRGILSNYCLHRISHEISVKFLHAFSNLTVEFNKYFWLTTEFKTEMHEFQFHWCLSILNDILCNTNRSIKEFEGFSNWKALFAISSSLSMINRLSIQALNCISYHIHLNIKYKTLQNRKDCMKKKTLIAQNIFTRYHFLRSWFSAQNLAA